MGGEDGCVSCLSKFRALMNREFPGRTDDGTKTCNLHKASVAAVSVLSAAWFSIDVAVITKAITASESNLFSFLTNDCWIAGLVLRLLMVVRYFVISCSEQHRGTHSHEKSSGGFPDVDTVLATCWLILGSAQVGIFFTFFTLVGIDETILNHYVVKENVKLSSVVIWNSLRHSCPVMLHCATTSVIVNWITTHTRAHHGPDKQGGPTLGTVLWTVSVAPLYGLVYFMSMNTRNTYEYSESYTGIVCAGVFATTCIAASLLLLFALPVPRAHEPLAHRVDAPYHYAKIGASLEG